MNFKTIEWVDNKVVMLDQRKLPQHEIYNTYSTYEEVGEAIKEMVVRGAPAIGVAAAMGLALGALSSKAENYAGFKKDVEKIADYLFKTRPTAVNLGWALEQMKSHLSSHEGETVSKLKKVLVDKALHIRFEDEALCRLIGKHGEKLFK